MDKLIKISYLRNMNALKLIPLFCLVVSLLASCSNNLTSGTSAPKPSSRATTGDRAVGEKIFGLINAERAKAGKKPLRGNRGLNELAQKQANYLSQKGQASTFGSINRAQYAYLRYNVENVTELANATPSGDAARDTCIAWMSSPEHRRTLLQSWNNTGIGVSKGADGRTYVTMLVGVTTTGVPRSVTPVGW